MLAEVLKVPVGDQKSELERCLRPMKAFCRERWWDVRVRAMTSDPDLKATAAMVGAGLEELCEDASALLLEAAKGRCVRLGFAWPECCNELFTKDFFGRTVGTFEQNAIGCR